MEFLKRNFLWISILAILLALGTDLFFDEAEVVKKSEQVTDLTGKTAVLERYVYSEKYRIIHLTTSLLYTVGLSLALFFGLEYKMDQLESRRENIEREEERKLYLKQITDLQASINQDVFKGVLEKMIPEELFKIVNKDILSSNIIRRNAKWYYSIVEKGDGWEMTQIINYDLCNIGKESVKVPIKINVHKSAISNSHFTYFSIDDGLNKVEHKSKTDIDALVNNSDNLDSAVIEKEIKSDKQVTVTQTVVYTYFNKAVVDSHFSIYSTLGLTIQVDKPANCDFRIVPTFSEKPRASTPSPKKIMYDEIKGILYGQSVIYFIDLVKSD